MEEDGHMPLVRLEQPNDIEDIRRVHERAFGRPDEARLVDSLRSAGKAVLSLVAVEGGRVVGHILFSPVMIESAGQALPGVGLAPMAVLPEVQRHGIGSLLVKTGLLQCQEAGHAYVVVLGHPEYYPRFGFVPASQYGIRSTYEAPDEAFMIVVFHGEVARGGRGIVRYQAEFDGL
jgi:putative acetyltransferase